MQSKLAMLRECVEVFDYLGALRIAVKFPRLGKEKDAITRGWEAHCRPQMYSQMGHNPAELFIDGVRAMLRKYRPDSHTSAWML